MLAVRGSTIWNQDRLEVTSGYRLDLEWRASSRCCAGVVDENGEGSRVEIQKGKMIVSDTVITKVLAHLNQVKQTNHGWTALCPGHDDHQNSLSIAEGEGGRVLLKCFAGCEVAHIVTAAGLMIQDLFPDRREKLPLSDRDNRATGMGCTLSQYSEAKQLPVEFLRGLGLSDMI